MNPLTLYSILGLAVALLLSLGGHWVQHQQVTAARAELKTCTTQRDGYIADVNNASNANDTNQVTISDLRTELSLCQGEKENNAALQAVAAAMAANTAEIARNRRALTDAARTKALAESAGCRANYDLPVCPDLLDAPP